MSTNHFLNPNLKKITFENKIKIDAHENNWEEVYRICERFISFLEFTKRDTLNILLVIEELFTNISKYSYPQNVGYVSLNIKYVSDTKTLIIDVEDEGIKFDPTSMDSPDLNMNPLDRKIGGLGIHMVRKIMDTMEYSYTNGKNKLVISKKINNRRSTKMGTVNLSKNREDFKVSYTAEGRIDTQSAPDFQEELEKCFKESEENYNNKIQLLLDFKGVEYLSSAGLRAILFAKKQVDSMAEGSTLEIINVQPAVMEVFHMTGFDDFLTLSTI